MPPVLLGTAVIFWGWQTGALVYAIPMAIVLEAARWVSWRFALDDKDFNRVTDLSSVGFVVMIIYQFDVHSFRAVYAVLALTPFVLFVLVALQRYGNHSGVKLTALFLSIRRAQARGDVTDDRRVDLSYPYFIVCLVAASAGNHRDIWFFVGVCALGAVALFHHRPRDHSLVRWCTLVLVAVALGYGGYRGAMKARWMVEPWVLGWFQEYLWQNRDPFRGYTSIGTIGRVKQSDRIVLRIKPQRHHTYPRLLREATYQSFSRNTWLAGVNSFEELEPVGAGTIWRLAPHRESGDSVEIASFLRRGRGLLAVPNGAYRIEQLGVEDLGQNELGTLRTKRGPGLVNYRVRYDSGASFDSVPSEHDLHIPDYYREPLQAIARSLDLDSSAPDLSLARLRDYFDSTFSYTLDLRDDSDRALLTFLNERRSGHCEYFATATVLLLRAAGIPARYATGYAVQEYSDFEKRFIVRRRHAHAWALVNIDGRWRDLDTTPAIWADLESAGAPWWEPVSDAWSWISFQFLRWRWSDTEGESDALYIWLLIPLVLILIWRLTRHERVSREGARQDTDGGARRAEAHSDFYRIVRLLEQDGTSRGVGETLPVWLQRVAGTESCPGIDTLIEDILPLHYRCRFDAGAFGMDDRRQLQLRVEQWLRAHTSSAHQSSVSVRITRHSVTSFTTTLPKTVNPISVGRGRDRDNGHHST